MNRPDFNSATFLQTVTWVGEGRNPYSPDYTVKRRFDPTAPKGGGELVEWVDRQGITVTWAPVEWNLTPILPDGGGGHFGMLTLIANVRGRWFSWNIEYLRKSTENTGTSSVNTDGWDGARDWVDVIARKIYAPDKTFRFADGDWFGLCVVPHPKAEPYQQNVRTDILTAQYRGPGPEGPPGPPPPPPPSSSRKVTWDLLAADIHEFARRIQARA